MNRHIVLGLASASLLWTVPALADSVSEFYEGKTVTVFSSGGAGGSHGAYAQLIRHHIGKFMPVLRKAIARRSTA